MTKATEAPLFEITETRTVERVNAIIKTPIHADYTRDSIEMTTWWALQDLGWKILSSDPGNKIVDGEYEVRVTMERVDNIFGG